MSVQNNLKICNSEERNDLRSDLLKSFLTLWVRSRASQRQQGGRKCRNQNQRIYFSSVFLTELLLCHFVPTKVQAKKPFRMFDVSQTASESNIAEYFTGVRTLIP